MAHVFNPGGRSRLDAPERDEWQQPDRLLDALGIGTGMSIADIGTGTGYFAIRLAALVGEAGRIYAVDVQHKMLDTLLERAAAGPGHNIIPVYSNGVQIPLPGAEVDLVFSANVAHEFDRLSDVMSECARILRPQGRGVIVDWKPEATPVGPPEDHRLPPEKVLEAARQAGLKPGPAPGIAHDLLPYQYILALFLD